MSLKTSLVSLAKQDMANDFPTTMFFGVHTSRIYPTADFPANCFFQEGTSLEARGLPFRDNTFDYVIQRFTLTGLSPDQRERNLKELMRVTKPGGYIEVVEADVPDVRLVYDIHQLLFSPLWNDL